MNELCVCTWNVNGIKKLKQFFPTLTNPDVLCLQETWASSSLEQLCIHDYAAFYADALPSQGPRAVGGLSTYFRMETFASGKLVKLTSPVWCH